MKRIIKGSIDNINKVIKLEQMNEVIKCLNNEDAYYSWIITVPDGASRDDFEYIANDDELYQ